MAQQKAKSKSEVTHCIISTVDCCSFNQRRHGLEKWGGQEVYFLTDSKKFLTAKLVLKSTKDFTLNSHITARHCVEK